MAKKFFHAAHPKEMYLLALTEMCQRFAFWGIGNLLVLYLVQVHYVNDVSADHLFGIFTGVAFVLPMLGGYIADRLGYRLPVIWGCLSTAAGCFLISTGFLPLIYTALALVAIGGAVFTPSVYAILGCIYRNNHKLRDGGFSIYYSAVNVGVFIALITLGALGQARYWNLAFIVAGCVQLLGLIPFRAVIRSPALAELSHLHPQFPQKASSPSSQQSFKMHKQEKSRIVVIVVLALFSILFWMAYNQGGSSMSLFALRFTDRYIGSFEIPPSWLLSAESLYLVILAYPLAALYQHLAKKRMDPSPPMKCALSLFAIGLCYTIMTLSSMKIPFQATGGMISPYYLLSAYGFMALGEMLICPIGLSLITHLSPHRYTAFLVGVWYCCIGVAFYLGGMMAGLMTQLKLSEFFNIFVIASFIPAIVLLLLSKKLDRMRHADSL